MNRVTGGEFPLEWWVNFLHLFTNHFSSPELLGSQGEFIYPWSVVVVDHNVQTSSCGASLGRGGGGKVCVNVPGHITRMAVIPIRVKT